jgi:hypothetical protein
MLAGLEIVVVMELSGWLVLLTPNHTTPLVTCQQKNALNFNFGVGDAVEP